MKNEYVIPYATATKVPAREDIAEALKASLADIKASYEVMAPTEIPKLKEKYEAKKAYASELEKVMEEKRSELERVKELNPNVSFEMPETSSLLKQFAEAIGEDEDCDDGYGIDAHDTGLPTDVKAVYDEYSEAFENARKAKEEEYEALNKLKDAEEILLAVQSEMDRIELGRDMVVRFRMRTQADKMLAEQEAKVSKENLKYNNACDGAVNGKYLEGKLKAKSELASRLIKRWEKVYEGLRNTNSEFEYITEIKKFIEEVRDLDASTASKLENDFNSELGKLRKPSAEIAYRRRYAHGLLLWYEDKLDAILPHKKKYDKVLTELKRAENSEWLSSEAVIPVLREQFTKLDKERRSEILRVCRKISDAQDSVRIVNGILECEERRCKEYNVEHIIPVIINDMDFDIRERLTEVEGMFLESSQKCGADYKNYDATVPNLKAELDKETELLKELKEQASEAAKYAPRFSYGFGARINPNVPSAALQMAHEISAKVSEKLGIEVSDISVSYNPEAAFRSFNGMPPKEEIILSMSRAAAKTTAKNSVKRQGTPTQWAIYFAAQSNRYSDVPDSDMIPSKYSKGITPYEKDTDKVIFREGNQDLYDMVSEAAEIPCLFGLSPKAFEIERKKAKILLETATTMKKIATRDAIAKEILIRNADMAMAGCDPRNIPILEEIRKLEALLEKANEADSDALYEFENAIKYDRNGDDIEILGELSDSMENVENAMNRLYETRRSQSRIAKRLMELRRKIHDIRLSDSPSKIKSKASAMLLLFDAVDEAKEARHEYNRACSELMEYGHASTISVIDALYDAMEDAKANVAYMATRAMYRSINNYLGDNRGIREDASVPNLSLDGISEVIADPRCFGEDAVSEFTARRRTIMRDAIAVAVPKLTPRQKQVLRVIYRTNGCVKESARILQIAPSAVRVHLSNISMVFSSAMSKVAPDSFEREMLDLAAIANELDVICDKTGKERVSADKVLSDATAKALNAEAKNAKSKASEDAEVKMKKATSNRDVANSVEAAIKKVIEKMSPAMREPVKLVATGMSKREAARRLGKTENAVRVAVKGACEKIACAIGDAVPELKESAKALSDAVKLNELIMLAMKK